MVIVNPTLPPLPSHIPYSFQGRPLAHLYVRFDPSLLTFVRRFITGRGYDKSFVSMIILDVNIASACVLLASKSIESEAIGDLNGATVRGNHKLIVLPFSTAPPSYAKAASSIAAPKTRTTAAGAGAFKLAISQAGGKHLPEYVIEQHITEHFNILWGKTVKIEKCREGIHSFFLFLASAEASQEAVAIFNDSLLGGTQIVVKFLDWEAKPSQQTVTQSIPSPRSMSHSGPRYEACKLFVYSNPKFPNFISEKDLLDHFKEFNPFKAYMIMKESRSTGVGVVFFASKDIADNAKEKMTGTKVLNVYSISLKYEDPSRPPKSPRSHTHNEYSSSRNPEYSPISSASPTSPQSSPSNDTILSSCSLKVSYLPEGVTVKKLSQLFGEFGELDGEPVIHFKGGSNPYAHVNFRTELSSQRALENLNHTPFEGSVITVKYVRSMPHHTAKKGQRPH